MEITIGVIVLFVVFMFKNSLFRKPIAELDHFELQFRVNQELSLKIQNDLVNYMLEFNGQKSLINDQMTFEEYLNFLKESHELYLTDAVFKKAIKRKSKLNKIVLDPMIKSLNSQFLTYQAMETKLRVLSESLSN